MKTVERFPYLSIPDGFEGECIVLADTKSEMRVWVYDGVFHRIGGPATITLDGKQVFYIDGKRLTPEKYWEHPMVLNHKLSNILDNDF